MNLLPLTQYLEDNGFGAQGVDIFVNMIPIDAPSGILLRSTLEGTTIDYYLPNYYKSRFQLIVRAANYPTGEANIEAVIAALTLSGKTIATTVGPVTTSMYFNYMRPGTLPVAFPLSKGTLIEFAVYMDVCFVLTVS